MKLKLHKGQRLVWSNPARVKMMLCGRRTGKSSMGVMLLLYKALTFEGVLNSLMPTLCIGALPTQEQAVSILWEPLMSLLEQPEIKPLVARINVQRREVFLKGNKPIIRIRGTNDRDGDRLRGGKIYFMLMDEAQDANAGILENVILPAMADTPSSSILLTATPKGRQNWLYLYYEQMKDDPDFAFFNVPTWSNPYVPKAELLRLKRTLPPRLYRQEVMASWTDFPGKIYSELDSSNLRTQIPLYFDYVEIGVDFGEYNPAVVVIGTYGSDKYVLEGWYPAAQTPVTQDTLDAVLLNFCQKWEPIAVYCDPSRASDILHFRAIGTENRVKGLTYAVEGYNPIAEGITQVHSAIYQRKLLFPLSTLHVTEGEGYRDGKYIYDEMNSYHYKTDRKTGLVVEQVEDGQQDHLCLDGDSLVSTDRGLVALKYVTSADKVLTRQGWKKVLWAGKTAVQVPTLTVTLSNGAKLTGTPNHPIFTDHWVRLDTLRHNEPVTVALPSLVIDTVRRPVVVEVVPGGLRDVYNLEVEDCPEFYANGVLVHNCDALRYVIARKKGAKPSDNIYG